MRATLLKGRTLRTPERALQAFSVYRNAAQTLSTAGGTKVAFNAREFDVGSIFDLATNHRATPAVAGDYLFESTVFVNEALTAGQWFEIALLKNGTTVKSGEYTVGVHAVGLTAASVAGMAQANGTTDYFEIFAAWSGPTTVSVQATVDACFFGGRLIGKS